MRESRSTVTDFKSATASQKHEDARADGRSRRFPITEALIRLINCKLTEAPPLETFADMIARGLLKKGLNGDVGIFREIREVVEGPVAQQIYQSWAVVNMPDDHEERMPAFALRDNPVKDPALLHDVQH
jgi:hypothetical protein